VTITGSRILLTGASSGIGAALAREFGTAANQLTLVARRRALLEELTRSLASRTHVAIADLSDVAHCTDWIPAAESTLGPIDVLVNNAGSTLVRGFLETDLDEAERMLQLDLVAPLRLTRAVLPGMIARGHGTIVDVCSIAAFSALLGTTYYAAAKAGLAAASSVLRGELRGTGVHVVTVYPGPIRTAMSAQAFDGFEDHWTKKLVSEAAPEKLAGLIRHAVERRRPRVIFPRGYDLVRHVPDTARWILDRLSPPLRRG
jgi:short-subunit dehydrogenase